MDKHIYVTKAYLPPRAEFDEYLDKIWDSAWLTNMGELHNELKDRLASYLGVRRLELFANGHLALEYCLQAMDFPEGGEVITTPFSFASTTHAIVRSGLKPVFCDIRESDCTIDPEKIESLITDKTVAILPVHVYGNPCDTDAIEDIARRRGLAVIYDAAHAFGETIDGQGIGNFGDASMFSFHATKVFNTIEGGCVTAGHHSWFFEKLTHMKNFGITDYEKVEYVGGNAKLNEFQAAMGLCNLNHIDENIAKRREIDAIYRRRLAGRVKFTERKPNAEYNYSYMPVLVEDRNGLFDRLAEHNIHARKYFYPCINDYDCYKGQFPEDTPIARSIAEHILTLPIYPDLENEAIDEICSIILE